MNTPLNRQRLYKSAQTHSKRVRWLKRLMAAICVVTLLIFGVFFYFQNTLTMPFAIDGLALNDGALTMSSPHIKGFDDNNRPYEVKAISARQKLDQTDIVLLDQIEANLILDDDQNWAKLTAKSGSLNTEQRFLTLQDQIKITSSLGYNAQLQRADIYLAQSMLISDTPITIKGPEVKLSAGKLTIQDNAKHIIFENNVKLTLEQEPTAQNARVIKSND